jgi:DNA repair protein RecN (Recombination protein N)
MGDAVCAELAPLKLGAAIFSANISPVDEANWSAKGIDKVAFQVATNPGAPAGPINKIASGGELARFMLALKVILANADPVPVLVFDEVDAGIGGAVASAVGERLAKLGQDAQVLVVTHSPQVAAQANNHFVVRKSQSSSSTSTTVEMLDDGARVEEIARMLSGETVTGEARAAADSLIKGAAA